MREKQFKYHPHKKIGKYDTVRGMFEETTVKLQKLHEAHYQFLAAGVNGMSGRYYNNLKYDQVQNAWIVNFKYNEQAVKEDHERKMRNVKQNATNIASSKESDEQKCVTLYKKNGYQTNGWKLAVYYTLTNMHCKQYKLVRYIREKAGYRGWDGTRDRELKNISDKVFEARKLFTKGSLKITYVEKLNYDKIQKWKSSTGHRNILGKKKIMDKMDDELIEYICELIKNIKRVTSWII